MARVIVVGGGLSGMAAAARLAKLRHEVTLLEQTNQLGGAVRQIGPATFTLPAALRDLFRKSGRPLERVLELEPVESPRRHVLPDGTVLDLPLTDRGGQREALAAAFGPATAEAWTGLLDDLTPVWELVRRTAVEAPFRGLGDRELRRGLRLLAPWRSLARLARRALPDPRAADVLAATALGLGADPRTAPGFLAVQAYVERSFGRWTCPNGLQPVVDALAHRLDERRVDVGLDTPVRSIDTAEGRVTGVRLTGDEQLPADVVVAAVPVADLLAHPPARLRRVGRLRFAPSRLLRARLDRSPGAVDLPFETVHHATSAVLRVEGSEVSVHTAGADPHDALDALRSQVVEATEVPVPPVDPVWQGARTFERLAPTRTPVAGLYCVGATAQPGPGVPYALLGAALAAGEIGSTKRPAAVAD